MAVWQRAGDAEGIWQGPTGGRSASKWTSDDLSRTTPAPGSRASTGSLGFIWSLTRRAGEVERGDVTWRLPCKHSRPHHKWSDAHADHEDQEGRREQV